MDWIQTLTEWSDVHWNHHVVSGPSALQAAGLGPWLKTRQRQFVGVSYLVSARCGFLCGRSRRRAVRLATLLDVLLQQRRQVGRVALQHGGGEGGQHCEPTHQLALDDGDWGELSVARHALRAQQGVLDAGSFIPKMKKYVNIKMKE